MDQVLLKKLHGNLGSKGRKEEMRGGSRRQSNERRKSEGTIRPEEKIYIKRPLQTREGREPQIIKMKEAGIVGSDAVVPITGAKKNDFKTSHRELEEGGGSAAMKLAHRVEL